MKSQSPLYVLDMFPVGTGLWISFLFFFFCLLSFLSFVVVVAISWAAPAAYGGSQARG